MHAGRPPNALQRPAEATQRENLVLCVWLQDVAHLGEGLHIRRLRQRLGRRQLIVGFEVSTKCRFWVSAEATANPMAILDLRTVQTLVSVALTPTSGVAMDFCGPTTFTSPQPGIEPLVTSLTGFTFIPPDAPTNVPTVPSGFLTGLTSDDVKKCVVTMAVDFFGRVL